MSLVSVFFNLLEPLGNIQWGLDLKPTSGEINALLTHAEILRYKAKQLQRSNKKVLDELQKKYGVTQQEILYYAEKSSLEEKPRTNRKNYKGPLGPFFIFFFFFFF